MKTQLLTFASVLTFAFAPAVNAGGPFGLFGNKSACDSLCDSACADGCAAASGCCGSSACDGGCCDSGACGTSSCDSACDSIGSQCCPQKYCSIFGGFNELDDYNGNIGPNLLRGTFSDGWGIGFAAGRRTGAFRTELEFTLRSNTADQWFVNGVGGDWSGHAFVHTSMVNLLRDFENFQIAGWTPYAGGGIGLGLIDGNFLTNMTQIEVEDEVFAYQLITGASKSLNNNVELFGEYRFQELVDVDVVNVGVTPSVSAQSDDLESDAIFFGLRIYR